MAQKVAAKPEQERVPLALMMFIGIGLSVIAILGLVYLFLRLIQTLRLNLAQSQFIAAVTHELRSPVTGIQLLFDTLSRGDMSPEKRKEFEDTIRKELKRLRDLVDQVLDTSRLEHSVTKLSLEPINIRSFLEETIDPFKALALSLNGSFESHILSDHRVLAHRRLLSMALSSILDNAIKYSSEKPQITLRSYISRRWAVIEIEDRGIGLSRSDQRKIFRRFYRADDARTQAKSGTGLGLYFCKLAVSAQGGGVKVYSSGPNKGTTFSVRVRVIDNPEAVS